MDSSHPVQEPSLLDINELLEFLPILNNNVSGPTATWGGGEVDDEGVFTLPFPIYEPWVSEFFTVAAKPCWSEPNYEYTFTRLCEHRELIREASLSEIRAVLTGCVRGERFCTGHWQNVIEDGTVREVLDRLEQISQKVTK
jgi:hypothetical protein